MRRDRSFRRFVFGRAGRRCLRRSEQLQFHSERQPDDVPAVEAFVGDGADEVEVAGAQFVVGRDAFEQRACAAVGIERQPLSDEEEGVYLGGEGVVLAWIAVGFLDPELLADDRVDVHAAVERFDGETVAAGDAPRDVALFGCGGDVEFVGLAARQESQVEIRLPLTFASVVPSGTEREETHAAGVLYLDVGGDHAPPSVAAGMAAPVERQPLDPVRPHSGQGVAGELRQFFRTAGRRECDRCGGDGGCGRMQRQRVGGGDGVSRPAERKQEQQAKNQPSHSCIRRG